MVGSTLVYDSEKVPKGSICEIYSPPRVVPESTRYGFRPGHSLDLTTNDPDGNQKEENRFSFAAIGNSL